MLARTRRLLRRSLLTLLLALLVAWGVIAYFAWQAVPLQLWHTFIPPELSADELDSSDWPAYLAREQQLFDLVEQEVVAKTPPEQQLAGNRYYQGSPINPARFQDDWNRSYLLRPEGEVKGVAVFLHGLTDSPYSLRHLAQRYRERGFIALGLRIPGHGTVPAGLVNMAWETWLAATRLAVREARAQAPGPLPLHLVGFSNGGALAVKYALDALEDKTGTLARPDRLVLISPMIGVTRFARFAGLKAVPALLPAFANAAWLGIMPEFNPFKYNSFPVNGARQSYRLTHAIQQQVRQLAISGELAAFPPALTFQSVMDYTVSTRSIIADLYHFLPANGSELVLFDINRGSVFGPLLNTASELALSPSAAEPAPALCADGGRQRGGVQPPDPGKNDGRRQHARASSPPWHRLPQGDLLPLPRGAALPHGRSPLRHGAAPGADEPVRYQPGRAGPARGARHVDRQSRCPHPHLLQPLLSLSAREGHGDTGSAPSAPIATRITPGETGQRQPHGCRL